LENLRVPKLEFREATLDSALQYLTQQASTLSGGDLKLNFVVKLSPEQQSKTITLSLGDIPLSEVLKYVAELAGVSVSYETHAIVIRPQSGETVSTAKP